MLLTGDTEQSRATNYFENICNDKIQLLKTLNKHVLDYQETKYSMEIIDDALFHFLSRRQREEPLYQFVKRLKTAKKKDKSHSRGLVVLSKFITLIKECDDNDKEKQLGLIDKAWE